MQRPKSCMRFEGSEAAADVMSHGMLLQTPVQPEVDRVGETIAAIPAALSTASVMASTDEEDMTQEAKQCVQALREGKRCSLPADLVLSWLSQAWILRAAYLCHFSAVLPKGKSILAFCGCDGAAHRMGSA